MVAVPAAPAAGAVRWGNQGTKCEGTRRVDYARLWGLSPGTDWVGICKRTRASGLDFRSNGKVPSTCVQKADSSVWAEWRYTNHPSCKGGAAERLHWDDVGHKCEGGNRVDTRGCGACARARTGRAPASGREPTASAAVRTGSSPPGASTRALSACGESGNTPTISPAGRRLIAAPTGPYAIAASGAAIGVASKAVEADLFEVWDTSLNVSGVFWVRDATCGAGE